MKKRMLIFLVVMTVFFVNAFAQTTLSPGDIAFTGYNADNPDQFSFVILIDLAENTEINFTDDGWKADQSFRTNENVLTWTVGAGGLSAGTQVKIYDDGGVTATEGSATGSMLALSSSGDQIFAYQGDIATPSLIAGIQMNGDWDADATSSKTSSLPDALTDGTNCLAISPEVDNAIYDMSTTSGNQATLLSAINNPSNWNTDNSNPFTLPPSGTFTVTTGGNTPPSISNISHDPNNPTSSDAVNVSADVTDSDGTITSVTCLWGTDGTTFPNSINMSTTRATYTTDSPIPAQTEGTTVYYKIRAVDDEPDTTTSVTNSYQIPYELTIYEIQGQTGNSPYDGDEVITSGIVTGIYSSYFTIQDSASTWNGIWIKDTTPVALGDNVTVQGTVDEEYYLTIIKNATVTINSSGNTLPSPLVVATGSVTSEEYEGVLVKVENASCSDADLGYGEWAVDDGSGACRIDDLGYAFSPTLGTLYNVTGPMYYSYSNFKIEPRDSSDVEDLGDYDPPEISNVVAMDDSTVIVYFNENVEETSAETVGNYSITSREVTISAAERDSTDNTKVTLTVAGMTEGDYTLTAIGVEDMSGNASNDSENFTYVPPLGDGDLVINEIMYNTPGYDNEWVELYNTTGSAIDLEGFYLLDNDDLHTHLTIPAGYSIPAYGYFTIVIDTLSPPLSFTPDYDGGAGLWSLGNGGDAVRLYDSVDRLVDIVEYDDASPWPTAADGGGPSLELIDPSYDNSLAASWQASFVDGGTPGEVNSTESLDTPTDLTITVNGTDIELNWTAVSGATGYNIYRSTDPYNFGETAYDTSTTNSYTDAEAGTNTKYFYRVTATN